jgi:hypothetical protein
MEISKARNLKWFIVSGMIAVCLPAGAAELEVGQKAPAFEAPDQSGKVHKLSDYQGKRVVLAFYPAAGTAG